MTNNYERILLVEHNPEIIDLISRQTLQPLGYQVDLVPDAGSAIQQVLKFTPDLIICALNLQGLSSVDLLMALRSQGLQVPMIVIAEKGQELDLIHAFRLGAKDFLLWPARDAEVVSVVDMWVRQIRDDQADHKLEQDQKKTIQELQHRVHELTALIAIGREILVTRDRPSLLEKLVESAVYLGKSNYGLLMLLNGSTNDFEPVSSWNLPEGLSTNNWKKWSDWINTSLVISGKTLIIQESQLRQLELDPLGRSAVIVPIKLDKKVIGSFLLVREMDVPFEKDKQTYLKVLSDYASNSLANVK